MELTAQQSLPVSQAQAWEALNDVEMLKAAVPGCDSLTPAGDNAFEAVVTAAIGPVKAKFKGKLQLENLNPPESYTLQFSGQGGPAGHGKGSAEIRLEPTGPHSCTLHYSAKASVGGKIAQVGSRLVDMAAQKMAGEFFERFEAALKERYGVAAPVEAEPPAAAAPTSLLGRLMAWLKRLFGG